MTQNPEEKKGERLNKFLARCGVGSRRNADDLIKQGRVSINGNFVEILSSFVYEKDIVRVDGEKVFAPKKVRMWRYHKPVGQITTHSDPENRLTVFSAVSGQDPTLPRLVSVGRLDLNSEGLLLLTNSGSLSRFLELPSNKWTRRYRVRAYGNMPKEFIERASRGLKIKGVYYEGITVELESQQGANSWYIVAIKEGKNREIRKIFEYFGLKVNRLIRTAYGPFQLGNLGRGALSEISERTLKQQLGNTYNSL